MRHLIFRTCGSFKERYDQELTIFETDFGRLWVLVALLFVLFILPALSSAYFLHVLNMIGIAAIVTLGLNLLLGYTGLISLGHGAFVGVGAYAAAILATRLNFSFWVSVPSAGVITALVGMIFGIPSVRLKHLYLTISTLAGQFVLEYVFLHWESLTRGTMGITLPAPSMSDFELSSDLSFYIIIYLYLVSMIWITANIVRTKPGRAFMAIRDNERAAEGMGIPLFRYKLLSFGISSFYAGIAGGLWAYYTISVTSEPFTLSLSIQYLAMVIIGGMGSIPGCIFGTMFITILNEILRWLTEILMNMGASTGIAITIAPLREISFGLAIILFLLFEPRGLAEVWRIVRSRFKLYPFPY